MLLLRAASASLEASAALEAARESLRPYSNASSVGCPGGVCGRPSISTAPPRATDAWSGESEEKEVRRGKGRGRQWAGGGSSHVTEALARAEALVKSETNAIAAQLPRGAAASSASAGEYSTACGGGRPGGVRGRAAASNWLARSSAEAP